MSIFSNLAKMSGMTDKELSNLLTSIIKDFSTGNDNDIEKREPCDCLENVDIPFDPVPGSYVDLDINNKHIVGVVLYNKTLLLIDPENHTVQGYLANYTSTVPYKAMSIRIPNNNDYKYSSDTVPVIWKAKDDSVNMSIADIEKALNLKAGSLNII